MLMYLVFFYRSPSPHKELSESSLFSSLKMALEEVLSSWYPAAGRLFLNPSTQKLDLLCSNSGALLVEASTRVKISELGDVSQYNSFMENLVYKPPLSTSYSEMPLVVAQVTRFGCGGYAVGVGTSHSLFDGPASYNFLRAWACKMKENRVDHEDDDDDDDEEEEEEEEEIVEPVHERGRLLVGKKRGKDVMMMRIMAFEHLHQLIMQASGSMKCINSGSHELMGNMTREDQLTLRTFSLSCSIVEKLKMKVTRCAIGDTSCSSFEVLAAHLWKAKNKALGFAKTDKMVCLQFTVDVRTRMTPPLPKAFTGNAYVLASIACIGSKLEGESLATIVEKIKDAKLAMTENYVKAYLEALEAPQESALPPLPELTIVSDWTRTPYHCFDIGLGNAMYASPMPPPVMQVAYFMQSPEEEGGVHVRIGLAHKYVHAFSHYFLSV
ncbi:Transferase protein [Dioscorea alata]|uniref:Transferase protein n=1 Tax=Dioscorea alata TaxID=55571 RepID=A0ACB7VLS2_DIOAL|nr:Transferase protein [Dioscorea alata]